MAGPELLKFPDNILLPEGTPWGQRQAVTASDALITVGAGAGTGKTWVLSGRYARLLLAGQEQEKEKEPKQEREDKEEGEKGKEGADKNNILPCDILTLTYTEAAASEMKQRIESRVRGLLNMPGAPVSAERKREILDGFGDAWISTIHAFAARLIRESGLSLDIDPRAAVISGPEKENFWVEVQEGVEFANMRSLAMAYGDGRLRKEAGTLDKDPLLGAAVSRWGAGSLSRLARDTAELHASMGHSWSQMLDRADDALNENEALRLAVQGPVADILRSEWRGTWRLWAGIFADLRNVILDEGDRAAKSVKITKTQLSNAALAACLTRWDGAMTADRGACNTDDEALRNFYLEIVTNKEISSHKGEPFRSLKDILGMTPGDWRKACPKTFVQLSGAFDRPFPRLERELRSSLLRFCGVAWGLWDSMKRRRGLLSFSDMILYARRAIESGSVEKSFRHVLVDEFQDTDPLQFALIESMITGGTEDNDSPKDAADRTSLFAVGDPKQSIYRFRHAEPSLFAETINRAGSRIELDVSFRTRAPLLRRINGLFSFVWRDGLGVSGAMSRLKFEPLAPAPLSEFQDRDMGTMPPFSVLLAVRAPDANTDKKGPARSSGAGQLDEARQRLAHELGRRISEWVQSGRTVWDKGEKILRPVRYSDFTVLARSRTTHDLLERALAGEGVPAMQDLSRNYFARGEVGDVICLLRAAADRSDEASLAGWLLSPFSDVPEEKALACLRVFAGLRSREQDTGALTLFDVIRQELPAASKRLDYLAALGRQKGAAGLLSLFDMDRRWLLRYSKEDRLRTLRNVRRALSIARAFQRGDTSSLTSCAEWMAHALRGGVDMDEPGWHSPGTDAVLLSVVHASKGLEYPVTILFDTTSKDASGKREASLRPSKALGVVFSEIPDEVPDADTDSEDRTPAGVEYEKLLSRQGDAEEDMRLFYVAATRAQDSLIICGLLNAQAEKESEEDEEGGNKEKNILLKPQKDSWTGIVLDYLKSENECGDDFTGPDISIISISGDEALSALPPEKDRGRRDERGTETSAPVFKITRPDWNGVMLRDLSATSFALFEWCPLAWRRRYRQGLDVRWESPDLSPGDDGGWHGGAELGSLAHWLLARWPVTWENAEAELENWLTNPGTGQRLPSSLRDVWREKNSKDALREWLTRFVRSEAGLLLRDALRLGAKREARFKINLDGLMLVGAMDVVWRGEGENKNLRHVMDYKITLAENAPSELYEAQLDFYRLVVREAALRNGEPCDAVDAGLVFLREGGRMERRQGENTIDYEALRARVLDVAHRGAAGDCGPNRKRCAGCPWRAGCPA